MAFNLWKPSFKLKIGDGKNQKRAAEIGKALGSQSRIEIISLICDGPKTISEIAKGIGLPISNTLFHISILETAKIVKISTFYKSKIVSLLTKDVVFSFENTKPEAEPLSSDFDEYEIDVGNYVDLEVFSPPLLMFGRESKLPITEENPFGNERSKASLLCFISGQISYRLKPFFEKENLAEVVFSLEICSEVSFYRNDIKSEVAFLFNDVELCSYICPGDLGGRKGIYNPDWYPLSNTQFGQLITIAINNHGVYLNGLLVNKKVTIREFVKEKKINLTITPKKDSPYAGGFNLFGRGFGDFNQGIKVIYRYLKY